MILLDASLREPLAAELAAVLIDLVALTRRAACASHAQLDSIADETLKRVLAFCQAQRGAILLSENQEHPPTSEGEARFVAVPPQTFRALALLHIQEEEASVLWQGFPATNTRFHSPDLTCWITYHLALYEGVAADAGESDNAFKILPEAAARAEQGQDAFLVLGWVNESNEACAAQVARCQALLPLVADAIGAVVASIVLSERVDALEHHSVREALASMELLKADLLGTVSHELRSPLASIKGYAATLLRHERLLGHEERHQFLLAINEASGHLEVIIERLLEVSQLETGQMVINRSPVDLAYLAGEAIAAIERRVEAQFPGRFLFDLRLEQADETPAEAVPLILADPRRLREVLDNLLENAVTYSPEGGLIRITLRPVVQRQPLGKAPADLLDGEQARITPVPRHMLELCVCDCGQGIPADHLQRIFERFHRVDTRLTRETSGLGLGLTICKRIVELHDGSIWAENRPDGKGSAFYVRLPLDQPPGRE